jgi:type I restriction enzyme S subunit
MTEWQEITLQEIAHVNPAESISNGTKAKKVPMELLEPFTKRVAGYQIEEYKGGVKFKNGDTIIARITPSLENGKTAFIDILEEDEVGFGSTEFIVLREREGQSDKHFLYYLSLSPDFRETAILSMTGSSGRQRVQTDVVKEHLFYIPSLPEQCAIASVLSSLDDKIDLLHRQNKTLEQMAEALFRQWFLPAGASAQTSVEEASDEWKVGKLGDEFDFTMGASPPGKSYNENGEGIPMYQGNADFGFRFPKNRIFTTEPKRFAEKYDTLISVRAPVGEQNMANERCCIGRGVSAFRYKHDNSFYTYTYYKMKSLMDDIKQFNETGTVFGSISKSDFENIEISIPRKLIVNRFQNEAKPIDDKIILNTSQIRTLEKLRDTLLPKLMSGEVQVEL